MQEYNYYDLLKLKPFPKKPGKEEIEEAAKKWLTETTKKANSAGTPIDQKRDLQEMIKVLPAKFQAFAANPKEQADQQSQYRQIHCAQLQVMAQYMKDYSGASIREATIRRMARQSGLDFGDVEAVFKKSAGFEVIKSAAVESVVTGNADLAVFKENLSQLEKAQARGVGHIPPNIGSVHTLYEYLDLILDFEGMDAIGHADWKAIQAKFNELSIKHAMGTEPFSFYRNIESKAKTSIFNNEANKRKYDRYVKLLESGLNDSLEAIAGLPESMRTDPVFARNWVNGIQEKLGITEEEAYLIYNQCCNIPPEEWLEKEDIQIRTVCSCGFHNIHESLQAAIRAKCTACGLPLYKPCPSCGEPVRNSADTCGRCGYFIPAKKLFDDALQLFRDEIRRRRVSEARKALSKARECKPQNVSLKDCEDQLEGLEKSVGSSLGKIDQLILGGKLNEAMQEMQKLREANPGMDLGDVRRRLEQKQREIAGQKSALDTRMRQLIGKPIRDQVQECMEILTRDENYEPALQHLRSTALIPKPVLNVQVTKNDTEGTVSISWTPNPENTYVTYTVVRMNTTAVPSSPQQGTVISRDIETTSCRDTKAELGMILYYAVFAVRKTVGVWSQAAVFRTPVALMPGVRSFNYTVSNTDCLLQWEAPEKCAGVMIERSSGSQGDRFETIQNLNVGRSYTDRNLRLNTQYTYRCTTLWRISERYYASSQSQIIVVSLQKRPDPVALSVTRQQAGGLCEVTWNTSNPGQMEIWKLKPEIGLNSGTMLEYDTLKRMGSSIWNGAASLGRAMLNVGRGQEMLLAVACPYGMQVILGTPVFVSTMEPISVNWDQIRLNADQLTVTADIPDGLGSIRVFLDAQNLDRETILQGRPFLSIQASGSGQQDIVIPNLPQRQVEIAIVGILRNGTVMQPSRCMVNNLPKVPVIYQLEWRKKGFLGGAVSGLSITVSVRGGHTPHTLLCYNKKNPTIPLRENEFVPERMGVLLDIPEGRSNVTQVQARDEDVRILPQGARLKLMLAPDVLSGYRAPTPSDAMALMKP